MRGRAIKVDGEVREASLRGWKEKNEYGWHLPKSFFGQNSEFHV